MIFEKIRERLRKWDKYSQDGLISVMGVMNIINQVETEYNNGWIKCEDKTFAVGCKYLVVDDKNDIYIATYLNDNVFIARDKNYFMPIRLEATYCQLLPLPPQPLKGE